MHWSVSVHCSISFPLHWRSFDRIWLITRRSRKVVPLLLTRLNLLSSSGPIEALDLRLKNNNEISSEQQSSSASSQELTYILSRIAIAEEHDELVSLIKRLEKRSKSFYANMSMQEHRQRQSLISTALVTTRLSLQKEQSRERTWSDSSFTRWKSSKGEEQHEREVKLLSVC